MVSITEEEIDVAELTARVSNDDAGANVIFLGTTRRWTENPESARRETTELAYECYEKMAVKEMEKLGIEASKRWNLKEYAMVHRVGTVPVGAASVGVAVSSGHRKEAFEAASWLIDTLKKVVPIWKQEIWADGSEEWIHPGIKTPADSK